MRTFVLLFFCMVLLASVPVYGVDRCGGINSEECACGVSNPFDCNGGNCTWWVFHQVCCVWGSDAANAIDNWTRPRDGKFWNDRAQGDANFSVNDIPKPNSIAVREGDMGNNYYGHVAWVVSVSPETDQVTVSEQFWGKRMKDGYQLKKYPASHFNGGFIHYFGWVSLSESVQVSPPSIIVGQEFSITFTLKETVGRPKTFEKIAVAILNESGEFLYDAKIFDNVRFDANETWTQTVHTSLYPDRPAGKYLVVIRGKLPGGNWFDFDVSGNGSNGKEFYAHNSPSPGTSCGTGQVYDCNLNCVDENTAIQWIGDGFCDDANSAWGYVLTCPAFSNDGGDCEKAGSYCAPGMILDCAGSCVNEFTAHAWIGDGYCDDASSTYGYVLTCPAFMNDAGDCDL